MKRLLSVLLAVCMLFSMVAIVPVTASAETTDNITVYFTDALSWGDVHVYYWPNVGEWPGTAMDKDIVNDYGQQVYKAVIPADIEGIIFNGNGNQTVDIKDGIEDGAAWYTIEEKEGNNYKVEKVEIVTPEPEPTTPETTAPETAEPTSATETTAPETGKSIHAYFTGVEAPGSAWMAWTWNDGEEGEWRPIEKFAYVSVKDNVLFANFNEVNLNASWDDVLAQTVDTKVKDGDSISVLNEKDGEGKYLVKWASDETQAPETSEPTTALETTAPETAEPTTAPETTAPETTAPETTAPETTAPAEGGFYISGTVSGWAPKAEFKLTKNDAAETEEYVFEGLELTTTDQFKIAYSEDGVSFKDTDWYPDGMGNNYGENGEITADGTYTVYFRPNVDGGDDWFYGCIYVAAPTPETTAPETAEPTTAPETTAPETAKPTTAPETVAPETTAPAEGGFYISGTVSGWAPKAEFKLTKNDAADTAEYVFEGLELTTTDQFKIAYSEDGVSFKDTDWYPDGMGNNYGENGEITADGTYTVYFRPNVDGGDDWFYGCIYVAEAAVETTAPETAEPTTAPETTTPETAEPTTAPETTAPAEGGFYISGTVSGWAPKAEFKLTKNEAAETEEYVFEGLELTTTDQFKIAYSEDGVSFKDTDWYPDGMGNNYGENGEITADGTYTVYFRPNVDGGDDWFYGCIYVAEAAVETTAPETAEPTTAPETVAPETTAPETTAPETTAPAEGGFYISGTVSGWAPKAEFKLTKNEAAETEEYVFEGLELTTTDQFKIAYSEDGVSFKDTDWYPDGMGNNYGENGEITADGTYTVYFRPNVDGGDDWFYGCIYVAAPAPETVAPETAEPTTAPETVAPETTAPETTAPETTAPAEGGFYISGTVSGWAPKAEFKLTKNEAAETEEYVFEGLELTTTDQFKIAYSEDGVSFKDTDWYPDGMGNNYGENGEITADGTYTVYFRPNVDGGDDWFYGCIYVAEAAVETTAPETTAPETAEPTTAPETVAPETTAPETTAPAEGGFYISGTVSGWAPKAEFKLTKNDAADTEEYVFEGLELTTTDQFKIAYSEDGVSFKDTDWYPDGMGNNYGENGEITADGTYTVYFRPNVDGGDDWFYGCIYVAAPAPETTPVETTPVETTPEETTPVETTPAEEKAIAKLPNVDDVVAEAGITDTFTVYFQMPDGNLKFNGTDGTVGTWENDYNELDGQNYAGIYWWQGAKSLDPWPGAKMTLVDAEQNIYSANVPFEEDVLTTIIFNNAVDGGTDKTADVYKAAHQVANVNCQGYDEDESDTMPEGTPKANFDGCIFILDSDTYSVNKFSGKDTIDGDWYVYYGDGHYGKYAEDSDNFVSIEENCCNPNHDHGHQPETTATETTAPETTAPEAGDYYIVGNMTDWAPNAEYKMTKNEAAETEEYMFTLDLTTESQFKVVYVEGEKQTWIPDGMGNNYGENGEITADGTYTVYFRPNVDGGDDWFYGCIYVAEAAVETTAPETTATETTAPETTAPAEGGFYISGTVSGWAPKAEFKLTKNDAAETEEYVFEGLELTTTDQFKIAYSEDGVSFKDTDWYPDGMGNNYGENGEITADGTYTVYFRPNVDGGDDWFYGCIYVAAPAPETTAPEETTATETTAPETTAPETTAPAEGGFYISGTVSGWAPKAEFKLTKNDAAETEEYVFEGLELTTTDQFKIAYSEDGVSFKDTDWYPDGMGNNYGENGEITADGTYTVYFRPNVDGGDDWFYGCIYVAAPAPETTAPEETTATETTAPETTAPAEGGFYISGTVSGWAPKAEFKLTKNDAAETEEYVFEGLELTTTDQFKIAYSEDGVSFKDTDWYPDGMGNNYGENGEITADGTYTVYFRPNVDGGDDWFYGCIYVAAPAPETTAPETTAPETTPVETTPEETTPAEEKAIAKLPNVDDVVAEAGITDTFTVYFQMPDGNLKFNGTDGSVGTWENDYNELDGQNYAGIYWWQGAKSLDPWPGAKMTLVDAEQNIYSANVPFEEDVLTTIIFNNAVDGGTDKTADVYKAAHQVANVNCQGYDEDESDTMPEGTPKANFDGCIFILDSDTYSVNKFSGKDTIDGDWYVYYGDGHYGKYAEDSDNFVSIEENCCNPNHDHGHQPETTATETTAPETTAPEAGDYYIVGNMTDWAPNAEYKMTKNEAAETEEYMFTLDLTTESQFKVVYVEGEKQTWIPDGMGNNYGENGEITADGTYTVYFRPNADGGDDWFYGCIYVAAPAPETTAPETTATETTAPETTAPEAGDYYIVGNMTDWAPNAEYKMTKNEAAETEEYMFTLDLTTESQFKVVYIEGEKQTWIPDGMGNNYGENGEITADGTYTVYFRPNVDGGDDWFYGCIYVAAPTPETTPTETTPEETTPVETTPEETTPVETTPVSEGGFYVVGTMNSWALVAEYKLTQNALGWYQLNGLELKTTDRFKVAYSADGVSFKDAVWYPDGLGNNYGENGEITVDGTYTLFFDPTVSGGSEWFCGCIFIDMPDPADMFLLGDADGSDEVDAVDATVVQRAATLVKVPYAEDILMQGDVDDDGELTVIDATFILRYSSLAPTPYRIGEYVSR